MNRIRKGDQVVVISGKDKGKRGDVVRVAGDKVVVSNINVDGFSLIHDEFNDHLILLPDVQLQKGNPAREVSVAEPVQVRMRI